MIDENGKYPKREFEMASVSGQFRYVVFDPEKHCNDLCENLCLTDEIQAVYKDMELSPENFEKAWNLWQRTPHKNLNTAVVCEEPPCRHGKFRLADNLYIMLCPGDLIFLDSENEPWAVSDSDGSRLRLINNGRLITKNLFCNK